MDFNLLFDLVNLSFIDQKVVLVLLVNLGLEAFSLNVLIELFLLVSERLTVFDLSDQLLAFELEYIDDFLVFFVLNDFLVKNRTFLVLDLDLLVDFG